MAKLNERVCPKCDGERTCRAEDRDGNPTDEQIRCPECDGRGTV